MAEWSKAPDSRHSLTSFIGSIWRILVLVWGRGFKSHFWQNFCHTFGRLCQNVYNIVYSQAVTHPSTNTTQCCLTSVIGRELVLSTWYGRRQWWRLTIGHVLKNIQVELSQKVWAGFPLSWNTLHKSPLMATLDNTSYTPKYKCRGSGFQSPKYWQRFKQVVQNLNKKMSTTSCIPRRSPIQVLTRLNVA